MDSRKETIVVRGEIFMKNVLEGTETNDKRSKRNVCVCVCVCVVGVVGVVGSLQWYWTEQWYATKDDTGNAMRFGLYSSTYR